MCWLACPSGCQSRHAFDIERCSEVHSRRTHVQAVTQEPISCVEMPNRMQDPGHPQAGTRQGPSTITILGHCAAHASMLQSPPSKLQYPNHVTPRRTPRPSHACPGRGSGHRCAVATSRDAQLQSEAERFVEALQAEDVTADEPADSTDKAALQRQYRECKDKVHTPHVAALCQSVTFSSNTQSDRSLCPAVGLAADQHRCGVPGVLCRCQL